MNKDDTGATPLDNAAKPPETDERNAAKPGADKAAEAPLDAAARLAKYAELRERSVAAIGEAALAMSGSPRYRDQTLADLRTLVLEPLMRDRIAVARAQTAAEGGEPLAPMTGIAIWATVSEEVDRKIREQVKAQVFPVRLRPTDWNSGKITWLLDIVAPNRALATAVVRNFRQIADSGKVKVHPIVAKLVEPETLAQMTGAKQDAAPKTAAGAHAAPDRTIN